MYRSIFIDGKIVNPKTGKAIDLRLKGSGGDTLPYLNSISIETEWGVDTNMSLSLTPPYREALELISKGNEWLRLGNSVALRWGYTDVDGAISDWHMGLMKMPEPSFGEEMSITVPVVGYGFTAKRVMRKKVWGSFESPITIKAIADIMAAKYGMTTNYNGLKNNRALEQITSIERSGLAQGGVTDLQFLMRQVAQWGAQIIIKNNQIFFVDAAQPGEKEGEVAATFRLYGRLDFANNIFPLDGFTPESMGVLFIQDHQGLVSQLFGPNSDPAEEPETVRATGDQSENNAYSADTTINAPTEEGSPSNLKNSDGTVNKAKAAVSVADDPSAGGRNMVFPGDLNKETLGGLLDGAVNEDASGMGIPVEFSSMGLPQLDPGMLVRLEGVGDFFSCVYQMRNKNLSVDEGGASMTCGAGMVGYPNFFGDVDSYGTKVKKHQVPPDGNPYENTTQPNPDAGE